MAHTFRCLEADISIEPVIGPRKGTAPFAVTPGAPGVAFPWATRRDTGLSVTVGEIVLLTQHVAGQPDHHFYLAPGTTPILFDRDGEGLTLTAVGGATTLEAYLWHFSINTLRQGSSDGSK